MTWIGSVPPAVAGGYVVDFTIIQNAAHPPATAGGPDPIQQDILSYKMNPALVKPTVPFSTLDSLDIRVGTIIAVEEVPQSAKLMRLMVSFGDHNRTILAGIKKERPNPQELQGRQALFVVNLEPRRMAGELSEGMLFDIGYADGITPVLAIPESAVPDGTRAG